ncbi:MAG: hypothetical protein Q8M57_01700 [Nitrosomonas sp.]|uniref:hypothetical protein n=1 Tax=Nitrosomonas sp. TaxID=42353 RepID=UPI0027372D4A|nr:hypothetical protein [Nitrosomonas sp.]MDP3279768.1 hypothetical protein [Nitrosomonas sp.]
MDEFEVLDGVAELFADGEAAGADMENIGAAVEDNAAVEEVANAPAIEDASSQSGIRNFIENNPYGKALWSFAKWSASTAAGASAAFGIIYGLNKAAAAKAHDSGNRTTLTSYLTQVQATYTKNGLPWNDDTKTKAATDALAFPWIDSTQ